MTTQHASDQAAALRCLSQPQRRATSIAITSGKGGVGKTNMAVNMSIDLARRGLRVVLMDLDLGLANADLLLGMRCRRNLAHVLSGACQIEEIMHEGPAGLQLVPGASGLESLANLSEFERHQVLNQLHILERSCDFLILDLGAGIARNVITFARAADIALVVTTPEPTSVADAYATVKFLAAGERVADVELLVNQVESRKEAQVAYERIAGVASKFLGLPVTLAGYVLRDETVTRAVRTRQPFVLQSPRSAATACVRATAKRYARTVATPEARPGFFRRVAELFA